MLNKTFLQGRLVADPELRTTQSGINVTTFRLAVNRDFKNQDGNREADFFTVVAWRGTADFVKQYFHKGDMAVVEGRLQVRGYEKDGQKRQVTEVIASNIYFGGPPTGSSAANNANAAPASDAGGFVDISDDDGELPF